MGSTDWVQSNGWQEGLFNQCARPGIPTPLPFSNGESFSGCKRAHSAGYVRGAAALVVIAFLTDFFGTLLTGLGLRSTDPNKKYKYYRVAIYSLGIAILSLFLALIIYPTSMSKDMEADEMDNDDDNDGIPDHLDTDDDGDGISDDEDTGPEREWNFGFGFGASWMCVILMFMSEVLLICDRESEEIFYKERDAEEGEEEEKEDD